MQGDTLAYFRLKTLLFQYALTARKRVSQHNIFVREVKDVKISLKINDDKLLIAVDIACGTSFCQFIELLLRASLIQLSLSAFKIDVSNVYGRPDFVSLVAHAPHHERFCCEL